MARLEPSELILSKEGRIYHLDLAPDELASNIFLVGDPGRVPVVSKYFDRIDIKRSKREFVTHTGWLGDERFSVISTGIGTDNIDIVLNEADAIHNIDLDSREIKSDIIRLSFIRLGTSGALCDDLPIDSLVCTRYAAGFDNLIHFYPQKNDLVRQELDRAFQAYMAGKPSFPIQPYFESADRHLFDQVSENMVGGITLTCPGFYGPQGRNMRAGLRHDRVLEEMSGFEFDGHRCLNIEMESSGIFGLCRLLGHRAASCNAILANRAKNEFSQHPHQTIEALIQQALTSLNNGI